LSYPAPLDRDRPSLLSSLGWTQRQPPLYSLAAPVSASATVSLSLAILASSHFRSDNPITSLHRLSSSITEATASNPNTADTTASQLPAAT
jgi:hypothetical protein